MDRLQRFKIDSIEELSNDLIILGKIKSVTKNKLLIEPTIHHVLKPSNILMVVINSKIVPLGPVEEIIGNY